MMEENRGRAFVYVTPDGMMQQAFVQLLVRRKEAEDRITFKCQPFLGTFELVEGWERR